MSNGTQLWGTDLATSLKKIQSEITDKIEDIQDVPLWKQAAKFIAPFAISALLPGIGTALTGLSGVAGTAGATAAAGGKGILAGLLNLGKSGAGILGKGLSMGKATGIKSFLHGLLSKGGTQAALGSGLRSLIDSKKKININNLNLSPLEKLYARDAIRKSNKDIDRQRKAARGNYLLADIMSAASGLIPKNPLDIFKMESGYKFSPSSGDYAKGIVSGKYKNLDITDIVSQLPTSSAPPPGIGAINPVTGLPLKTLPGSDYLEHLLKRGIEPPTPSIPIPGVNAPIVPGFRKKNLLEGLTRTGKGYEKLYFQGDDPKQNPVTLIEELFRKNR